MSEDQTPFETLLIDELGIDARSASLLGAAGLTTIEELAYVPLAELHDIEGLSSTAIVRLRELARRYLDRGLDDQADVVV